jgi:Domain of unknown function (DUF3482)/50S ribosome-binding GTPase
MVALDCDDRRSGGVHGKRRMSHDHPVFAVVGHPNKGKSSIVATLAEDESIAISADPGTTRAARSFTMRVESQVLYELIDTPGFQRARATLAWLQDHERGANERTDVLREFVRAHESGERFRDECELLRPILAGAGVLYVVDGAHPFGQEYEAEMEILRWTGQPRMALINRIGAGDYVDEWRRALNQYFSIVRQFDAQHADFAKRLELLRAFRELDERQAAWSASLDRAVRLLEQDRRDRQRSAAREIADLLIEALSASESSNAPEGSDEAAIVGRLTEQLKEKVRERERSARRMVQDLYRHRALAMQEAPVDVLAGDVFSERSFAVFGLSASQLAITGAATGALAGGAIDLAVGGASLLLGAGIGALVGGISAVLSSQRLAKVKILGTSLGGHRVIVGPISSPNLPWVMLGRALLHHRLVFERNHARREALIVDASSGLHLADAIVPERRKRIAAWFEKIRKQGGLDADQRDEFIVTVEECMGEMPHMDHPDERPE